MCENRDEYERRENRDEDERREENRDENKRRRREMKMRGGVKCL